MSLLYNIASFIAAAVIILFGLLYVMKRFGWHTGRNTHHFNASPILAGTSRISTRIHPTPPSPRSITAMPRCKDTAILHDSFWAIKFVLLFLFLQDADRNQRDKGITKSKGPPSCYISQRPWVFLCNLRRFYLDLISQRKKIRRTRATALYMHYIVGGHGCFSGLGCNLNLYAAFGEEGFIPLSASESWKQAGFFLTNLK